MNRVYVLNIRLTEDTENYKYDLRSFKNHICYSIEECFEIVKYFFQSYFVFKHDRNPLDDIELYSYLESINIKYDIIIDEISGNRKKFNLDKELKEYFF